MAPYGLACIPYSEDLRMGGRIMGYDDHVMAFSDFCLILRDDGAERSAAMRDALFCELNRSFHRYLDDLLDILLI
jgi:hypothetical protein